MNKYLKKRLNIEKKIKKKKTGKKNVKPTVAGPIKLFICCLICDNYWGTKLVRYFNKFHQVPSPTSLPQLFDMQESSQKSFHLNTNLMGSSRRTGRVARHSRGRRTEPRSRKEQEDSPLCTFYNFHCKFSGELYNFITRIPHLPVDFHRLQAGTSSITNEIKDSQLL
jgi:hypothetical protein